MNASIHQFSAALFLTIAVEAFGQPVITKQPIDQSASLGANLTTEVRATGTAALSYHWQFNGVPITGGTNRTLVLTNIQVAQAGEYVVVISDPSGFTTSRVAKIEVDPAFRKVTSDPVVLDLGSSWSCAWGDYDGDGYEDLFVANQNGNSTVNFLYRNNGNGSFTRISTDPVGSDRGTFHSAAWADYDNDGFLDLLVTNGARDSAARNFLYRNLGGGSFARVTTDPLATNVMLGMGATWGDFDNDGFVDVFIANLDASKPNHAYKNNGDGTFARITQGSLVAEASGSCVGCAWGDYDNDGRLDLFVPKAMGNFNDLFYRNVGRGEFTKVVGLDPVLDGRTTIAAAWGDYDNDGFLDLFVTAGGPYGAEKNLLYHNNRMGGLERVASAVMTTNSANHTGCAWGDYDNDGCLDLFVCRTFGQKNLLYHNNGDGTFTPVTTGSLVNDAGVSYGCTWADFDNDGFLDLYVCNGGGDTPQANFLYQNSGNSNSWLKLRLVGTVSNRAAIGAKVRALATIHGTTFWQLREISGGGGQGSQNSLIVHFGFGDATLVDTVHIEWPSGIVQELHDVLAKQFLTVAEPSRLEAGSLSPEGSFPLRLTSAIGFQAELRTSQDLKTWTPWRTVTMTNRTMLLLDSATSKSSQQFYRAVNQ